MRARYYIIVWPFVESPHTRFGQLSDTPACAEGYDAKPPIAQDKTGGVEPTHA
jgi:hypothetical protein